MQVSPEGHPVFLEALGASLSVARSQVANGPQKQGRETGGFPWSLHALGWHQLPAEHLVITSFLNPIFPSYCPPAGLEAAASPLIFHLPTSGSALHEHAHSKHAHPPWDKLQRSHSQIQSHSAEKCTNERQLTLQVMHFNGCPLKCLYPTMKKKKSKKLFFHQVGQARVSPPACSWRAALTASARRGGGAAGPSVHTAWLGCALPVPPPHAPPAWPSESGPGSACSASRSSLRARSPLRSQLDRATVQGRERAQALARLSQIKIAASWLTWAGSNICWARDFRRGRGAQVKVKVVMGWQVANASPTCSFSPRKWEEHCKGAENSLTGCGERAGWLTCSRGSSSRQWSKALCAAKHRKWLS